MPSRVSPNVPCRTMPEMLANVVNIVAPIRRFPATRKPVQHNTRSIRRATFKLFIGFAVDYQARRSAAAFLQPPMVTPTPNFDPRYLRHYGRIHFSLQPVKIVRHLKPIPLPVSLPRRSYTLPAIFVLRLPRNGNLL